MGEIVRLKLGSRVWIEGRMYVISKKPPNRYFFLKRLYEKGCEKG